MKGKDTSYAARILREGGLVAIPTETVYGLAANALDSQAVLNIFKAKNRPSFDPLIVHCRNAAQAESYAAVFPEPMKKLAEKFWPGPLTLILPKTSAIPDVVSSGLPSAGFRVPNHPLTLALLQELEFPLAAPSANPFGYVSPTSAEHVEDQLKDKIDYILDGGSSPVGLESTIVGQLEDGQICILRYGGIPVEQIEEVVGPVVLRVASSASPLSPGQLDQHYAPHSTFIVCQTLQQALDMAESYQRCGLITPSPLPADKVLPASVQSHKVLSPSGHLDEAAQHLFAAIRSLDKGDFEAILAVKVADEGLGRAINDRLRRASHL